MRHDIVGGCALALRHGRSSLGIVALFAVVTVVLALLLGDVLTQASTLKEGATLRKANAVATTPYYLASGMSTANDQALALLGEHATTGTGYSVVIDNIAINDPDLFGGTSALIVTGPVVFEVFTRLGTGCPAPCVLRGADLPTTTEPLHFRGLTIPQGAMLPRGAVWFDPNAAGVNLDGVQLLVLGPTTTGTSITTKKKNSSPGPSC